MDKFMYDEYTDSVIIANKQKTDKVEGSVKIGDIILDMTKEGKIVGLEIRHATDFFKECNIEANASDIISADFTAKQNPDNIIILLHMQFKEREETVPLYLSTEAPMQVIA